MILLREKTFTLVGLLTFYKKRVKRIFPAYYLLLFLVLTFGYYLLATKDYAIVQKDSIWAAGFLTNVHKYLQNLDYFAEVIISVLLYWLLFSKTFHKVRKFMTTKKTTFASIRLL